MLYSIRMDRGGNPGQVTELFQVALKKSVGSGFLTSVAFCKAGIFD